ncbi:MAG: CPBP family intramembrane glutamic endopeptidase [Anaerolineales bacterium]|nr:CPBP family intramembrane glutamic endopeptidase [Anaerolineales bacterium]
MNSWPSPLRVKNVRLLGVSLDLRLLLAVVIGTVLLTIDYYYRFLPAESYAGALRAKSIERLVYYLLVPLAIIAAVGDRPREYGLQLGKWKWGLTWALASALVAAPVLIFTARSPAMVEYYAQGERGLVEVLWVSSVELLGWEFFFRGFLLSVLGRLVGPNAILLQAVPFALAHLGKPPVETLSTIFGGIYFGFIAWRSRSFLYAFLLHLLINLTVVLTALQAGGELGL